MQGEVMWSVIGVILILALAFAISRATRGTVFRSSCGCTPNIARLKNLESSNCGSDDPHGNKR